MNILWMSWKDRANPLAGGAEVINEALAERLVKDGHSVTFLVGGWDGAQHESIKDGYKIIRVGSRFTVYLHAYRYYKKHLQGQFDLVIDEVNTIPFLAKFYVKEESILFIHQLAREIWFYEMFFPLSLVGYLLEPIYLWMLRNQQVITVSESTKKDLLSFGFKENKIQIISEGIELEPVKDLSSIQKYPEPTILSMGSIRSMKRTDHIVKAFEIARASIPSLKLVIAGAAEGAYGQKIMRQIEASQHKTAISYLGKVSIEAKLDIMRKAHLICVTSVKEGWGLIVTEAASQGTPAVVYDVDGLRDSVRSGKTGVVAEENTPEHLAQAIIVTLQDQPSYETLRQNAWEWSKTITFEKAYRDLMKIILSL